ncbi:lipase 3-like [Leguminivora glycinivorella]|uniref:lipase 3-like n=1 Tax=Leguminivora glycinivorella TaxID=1035111 RepID=UPI00200D7756|nr:lipase 3-like [Leguminivora glycinivorella]
MEVRVLVVVLLGVLTVSARTDVLERRNNRLIDRIKSQGYSAELHRVVTKDGYVLGLHRIPHGKNGSPGPRPVVFVMHGLMSASSHFVHLGSEYALAYNLADAGYDVWMGNHRGNRYSREHVSLNPNDSVEKLEFFDYSYEDVGLIDLPAMIDYALAASRQEKLHYIGHSQGGTVFLALASLDPEYSNKKIASAHLLAGVGYSDNFPSAPLKKVSDFGGIIYTLGSRLGIVEISFDALRRSERQAVEAMEQDGVVDFCAGDGVYKAYCEMIGVPYLLGDRLSLPVVPEMGGASLKQLAHFAQNIKDGKFRRWDYGPVTNLRVYRSFIPPSFDLRKITIDVTMHYSLSDIVLNELDVLAMAAVMPNSKARKIERDTFKHEDYIFSKDSKELVNDHIIEALNQF